MTPRVIHRYGLWESEGTRCQRVSGRPNPEERGLPGRPNPEGCHGFPGTPRTFGGCGGPFRAPHVLSGPRFPDLVAVAVAVRVRQQGRPSALAAEAAGLG